MYMSGNLTNKIIVNNYPKKSTLIHNNIFNNVVLL